MDDHVSDPEALHSLPAAEELKVDTGYSSSGRKRKILISFGVTIVLMLVFVIGLSVGLSGNQQSASSLDQQKNEQSRLSEVIDFLSKVSKRSSLEDFGGPQGVAAHWIADIDMAQYDIPESIHSPDAFRFLQRYALVVFYYALGGGNSEWVMDHHFVTHKDECGWFDGLRADDRDYHLGAVCNGNGEVVKLSLPGNNLVGNIPGEIGLLTSLTHLSLFGNSIYGSLPKEMRELTSLDFLGMESNDLTGSIPDWFGNFDKLRYLDLGNNLFTGTLSNNLDGMFSIIEIALDSNDLEGKVDIFNTLPLLQRLYLGENRFTGVIDDNFFKRIELSELDLSSNQFQGKVPFHFFANNKLQMLDLHNNTLTGGIPSSLPDVNTRLTFLALHDTGMVGTIPESLAMLHQLEHLDLSSNLFSGDIPTFLTAMTTLTYLFLASNQFNEGPIPDYSSLKSLREISLKHLKRTGQIPSWFGDLSDLVLLDLDQNKLTGEIPSSLANLKQLQFMLLNRNYLEGSVPSSFSSFSNLSVLLLERNNLKGDLDVFCGKSSLEVFISDCDPSRQEVVCTCCTKCCSDSHASCNPDEWLANFDPSWENGFVRDQYVFSEDISFQPKTTVSN